MPRDTAASQPVSRTSPARASLPRAISSRISPPRISPPQVNANRVCSGNHPQLKEEKMVQVKRAIPVAKVSPLSPTPEQQSAAQDTENIPAQTQTQEEPVIENVVHNHDRFPRNTGVVFNHLAPRDQNIPDQQPRQRVALDKNKTKFSISSISCITVSTSSSENEHDASDPFAPPARGRSLIAVPQRQSLLTESLRLHSHMMEPEPSTIRTADQGANSSRSQALARSTGTAQPVGGSDWVDPALAKRLLRERDILVYGPFQRVKGKRYFDEPIPTKQSKTYVVPPSKPLKPTAPPLPPTKSLKPTAPPLPPTKPLKPTAPPLPPTTTLKPRAPLLPPSKQLKPTAPPSPPSKPLKPTAPPFPSEPSCPGLTPSSVAVPARVGRAPNRPAEDRPAPDRPRQQAEQARRSKAQASKKLPPRRLRPRGPNEPFLDGECWEPTGMCLVPSLGLDGSNFCKFHCCSAITADGNRCPNLAYQPSFDEEIPVFCKKGYHKENGTYGKVDKQKTQGVILAGQKKLQEESDSAWYAKLVAIVLPHEMPDIEVTPELFEELFHPDSDDEGSTPKTKVFRRRREAQLTGITNDDSARPVRKFLTMTHIMSHPKLKRPPQVVLTAEQEAEFLREAEGGLLPRKTPVEPVEEPKVAPKPNLMFMLPPRMRFVDQPSDSSPPEWMYEVGFKRRK